MAVWFSPNHETEFSDVGTFFETVFRPILRTTSWLNL